MKYSRSSHHRGFTLVEVLATMVLLAIVLPVALKGASLALSMSENARNAVTAAQLADSKIQELAIGGGSQLSMGSGDFGNVAPGFTWSTQTQTGDYDLTLLTVTVSWNERGTVKSVSTSTLVGSEPASNATETSL